MEPLHVSAAPCDPLRRQVRFGSISFRFHERILGDHPSCSSGPALSIGWNHDPQLATTLSVDQYEEEKINRRHQSSWRNRSSLSSLLLDRSQRELKLLEWGVTPPELAESGRQSPSPRRRRPLQNRWGEPLESDDDDDTTTNTNTWPTVKKGLQLPAQQQRQHHPQQPQLTIPSKSLFQQIMMHGTTSAPLRLPPRPLVSPPPREIVWDSHINKSNVLDQLPPVPLLNPYEKLGEPEENSSLANESDPTHDTSESSSSSSESTFVTTTTLAPLSTPTSEANTTSDHSVTSVDCCFDDSLHEHDLKLQPRPYFSLQPLSSGGSTTTGISEESSSNDNSFGQMSTTDFFDDDDTSTTSSSAVEACFAVDGLEDMTTNSATTATSLDQLTAMVEQLPSASNKILTHDKTNAAMTVATNSPPSGNSHGSATTSSSSPPRKDDGGNEEEKSTLPPRSLTLKTMPITSTHSVKKKTDPTPSSPPMRRPIIMGNLETPPPSSLLLRNNYCSNNNNDSSSEESVVSSMAYYQVVMRNAR